MADEQRQQAETIVRVASFWDFLPVLYIIDAEAVKDRWKIVPPDKKVGKNSQECIVEDLKPHEFQLLDFQLVYPDSVTISKHQFRS